MFEVLKPFAQLFAGKKVIPSRWIIGKTLLRLAFLKRMYPDRADVTIRLGKYTINAPDYHLLSTLLKEKFVYNEYFFSSSNTAPVIIDGGSNIGISVLYFKYLYPNSIIHCFEPYSRAYAYLEKNVELNNLENVYLNRFALSDVEQSIDLYIPQPGNTINPTLNSSLNGKESEKVKAVRLSDYISQFPGIDLIKLDVEGSEVAIINELHASASFVKNSIKKLIVEFHSSTMNGDDASQKFINLLNSHFYKVDSRILQPHNEKSDLLLTATTIILKV